LGDSFRPERVGRSVGYRNDVVRAAKYVAGRRTVTLSIIWP
jgi:hypothetical protein